MKLSSAKPIKSPSRAEKFPTPLMMRFLRSNVGSRNRGKSSSSPIFIMRANKKNVAVINDASQEDPSSPKVTCIGQVRAKRTSKANEKNSKAKSNVPRTHFCGSFTPNFRKPGSFLKPFREWATLFRFGYCKKIDVRDDCSSSSKVESIQRGRDHVIAAYIEINEENSGETKEDLVESSSSSPPKNALLLTRSRSASHRYSSDNNTETEKKPKNELQEMPISPDKCGNEAVESRNSSSHDGMSEELNSSSNVGKSNEANCNQNSIAIRVETKGGGGSVHPLILTRCKSEPAKTGERFDPVKNYWLQRRSDTTESC